MTSPIAAAAACLSLCLASTHAQAAPDDQSNLGREPFSFTFRYDRAALDSMAGAKATYARLMRAVERHCTPRTRFLAERQAARAQTTACMEDALARAVRQIGDPMLAQARRTFTAG